jgi:predicted PurR-regulated permease PerM
MKNNTQKMVFLIALLTGVTFVTSIHTIITPFLLAATLAYLAFPLINFIENKTKWSRIATVIIVYTIIISGVFSFAAFTTFELREESSQLSLEFRLLDKQLQKGVNAMPDWVKTVIRDNIQLLDTGTLFTSRRLWPYFTGALSGLGSLLVFLVATFYFLKEGDNFVKAIIRFFGGTNYQQVHIITRMRQILDGYLRGQFLLVLLMSAISFVILSILKVKYALLLGIFTGFAEIVPFIGPIIATTVVSIVALLDGVPIFALPPAGEVLLIIGIYFVIRQLEDYFVIPYVMGRVTKLHPLAILFLVLVGGHIWGVFGMILAVPFAALLRLFFENE